MKSNLKATLGLLVATLLFVTSCKKSSNNTSLVFQNNTQFTLTLTAGSTSVTMVSGDYYTFSAPAGTVFTGTATTTGTTGFANQWNLNYVFPSSGSTAVSLDEHSSLVFQNNTYTPVVITAGGSSHTINAGSSLTYTSLAGTSFSCSATTSGSTGLTLNWTWSTSFPSTDYATIPINVSSSYFFLFVDNTMGTQTVNSLTVNYALSDQTNETVSLPPGAEYAMGYYDANPDPYYTIIKAYSNSYTWSFSPVFNFANVNLSYTAPTN